MSQSEHVNQTLLRADVIVASVQQHKTDEARREIDDRMARLPATHRFESIRKMREWLDHPDRYSRDTLELCAVLQSYGLAIWRLPEAEARAFLDGM